MKLEPPDYGVLELSVGWKFGRAGMVVFTTCPSRYEGLKEISPRIDVSEVTSYVTEHQILLMLKQDTRDTTRRLKNAVASQQPEAIAVNGACSDTVCARRLKLLDLVSEISCGDSRKREEKDPFSGNTLFQKSNNPAHQSIGCLAGAGPREDSDSWVIGRSDAEVWLF